ncbi:hypothetical protein GN956_G1710 [Arapaima gigas]
MALPERRDHEWKRRFLVRRNVRLVLWRYPREASTSLATAVPQVCRRESSGVKTTPRRHAFGAQPDPPLLLRRRKEVGDVVMFCCPPHGEQTLSSRC